MLPSQENTQFKGDDENRLTENPPEKAKTAKVVRIHQTGVCGFTMFTSEQHVEMIRSLYPNIIVD